MVKLKLFAFLRLSLFTKFIIAMVSLAAIPVIITGWQLIEINRKGLESTILELHTHLAESLSEKINTYLERLENQMQFVIKSITEAKGQSQSILQALLDSDQDFVSISLVNRKGDEMFKVYNPDLLKDTTLLNLSDRSIFKQIWDTKNNKTGIISGVYFEDRQPHIDALYKITQTHLMFATLSLSNLWKDIEKTRLGKSGYAFLVDSNGTLIAHPDISRILKKENVKASPIVEDALQAISVGASEYTLPNGNRIVGAYAPVPAMGWGVIIEQLKSEAFITERKSRIQASVVGLSVIVIAIVIAFFMARNLSRPIMHLINGAERVAAGDFTTQVDVHTRDELRDLSRTFNSMTRKLKEYADLQVDKIIAEKTKTEAIIFSIADGIIMTDHTGKIQLINNQALQIFDIPPDPEGFEGKKIYELVPKKPIIKTLQEIIANPTRDDIREIDLSIGETARFYKVNAGNVKALKGENLGIVTVVHDITLEKQIENLKEEFLHSITHDLRNPMTSIKGFLKFLLDGIAGEINEQQKKMLTTMDRASEKLLTLINDILDIAKLEAGKLDVALEQTNLREMGTHVIEAAQGISQRKQITFEFSFDESLNPINADKKLVERVITNLIGNAVKFTPDEGHIILEIKNEDNNIRVAVIDNGEGIPPDYIDKVFDKFKQVAGQRKGGTGLGLTICKYLVESHRGRIWVESKLGVGSKFIFTIPKNLTKTKDGKIVCV